MSSVVGMLTMLTISVVRMTSGVACVPSVFVICMTSVARVLVNCMTGMLSLHAMDCVTIDDGFRFHDDRVPVGCIGRGVM